jgi:hypothetical protein
MILARLKWDGQELILRLETYENGNTAVVVQTEIGEPYAVLSVNVEEKLPSGSFYLKDYAENAEIAAVVTALGIFEPMEITTDVGWRTVEQWRLV